MPLVETMMVRLHLGHLSCSATPLPCRSQRVNALGRRAGPIAEAFHLECVGRTCHLGNRHALAQVPGSRAGNAGSPFASSNEQSILGLVFVLRKSATYSHDSFWPKWACRSLRIACFGTECNCSLLSVTECN